VTTQRGVALLTGLVLLAALSLLAIVSARGMLEQRRLAGNFESRRLALANARLAEATASAWLFSRADIERQVGCAENCVLPVAILPRDSLPDQPEFQSEAWWRDHAHPAGANPETGEFVSDPGDGVSPARWIMEEAHYSEAAGAAGDSETMARGTGYYRIISRGTGYLAGSPAAIEMIAARPWGEAVVPAPYPPQPGVAAFCSQFAVETPCGVLAWRQLR
jgi:Tfp pilus assembly protein PilX